MDRISLVTSQAVRLGLLVSLYVWALHSGFCDVAALMRQGDGFDARLQTDQALAVFLEAEKLDPHNAEILQRIAMEYGLSMKDVKDTAAKRERGEMALIYAKRAVEADPGNSRAQLALSISYGRLAEMLDNQTKIAYSRLVREHAGRALALDPSNDLPYHILGAWNYELARLNPILRTMAAAIYGALPAASNEEAIRYFQQAVKINPARIGNRVGLGLALAAAGDKTAARKELEMALALPPREKDDPEARERARRALARL